MISAIAAPSFMLIPPRELADVGLGLLIDSRNRNPRMGKVEAAALRRSSAISFCIAP